MKRGGSRKRDAISGGERVSPSVSPRNKGDKKSQIRLGKRGMGLSGWGKKEIGKKQYVKT